MRYPSCFGVLCKAHLVKALKGVSCMHRTDERENLLLGTRSLSGALHDPR